MIYSLFLMFIFQFDICSFRLQKYTKFKIVVQVTVSPQNSQI